VTSEVPSLTILGSSCAIPRPGRACSSYLIEDRGRRTILDFGTGAFANLRLHLSADMVDAIVISHMHTDHFLDLIPLRYALRYGEHLRRRRLEVYLPPGGIAMLEALGAALSRESGDFFHDVYELHEYDAQTTLRLGDAGIRFAQTTHYIAAYAMRYESGASSLVYSADTAYEERLATLARRADLFLCEATLGPHGREVDGVRGHISAEDAGRLAQAADVKRLLLTHYGAECDPRKLKRAARISYSGEVRVVDDHQQIAVGADLQAAVRS
jgi:ribonuclease BN (tRNA processing enzyme)